ncbi:MYCBP-associated protein-like [Cataglyphis hispanica]|uniref:MYCBP-associated protein-like n=1 Tax=Cataglyphis hispanica TaxID=1086592 RepID=UPI002180827B|nr:MYCBP-associated protein-like [Cataglyphis hispanica]
MDFARRIGKSEERKIWKRTRKSLVTTRDNLLCEETVFSEDRPFLNWRKWLADRKKQNRRIEKLTGRPQADQLQSSSERFRAFVEMKSLMEHAAIPVPVIGDKYRGGPEFWRTPEFLPNHDCHLPKIALTPTRKDLNLPPDLMHVGLPDLIAKERDLIALKTKEESWKRSKYLKTRKVELAEEIALLLPKEPETEQLVVQGHKFEKKKKPLFRHPLITITKSDDEKACLDADQAIILKIQDQEFIFKECLFESMKTDPITWSLTFSSNIDELVEKEIVLENKGTRVIVYHWRDWPTFRSNLSLERRGSPFFFNKTKGIILPGQIVKIKIWYRSRTRAVFTESWRLIIEPRLSSSAFVFRFWGCAIDSRRSELTDHRAIEEHLDHRIRDLTIHSIVEEIMTNVETSKLSEPPYKPLLSPSDLFTSLNPYYYYHLSIVMQLQKMYCDVIDESLPPWNLSLDTLRDILLQIEDANYKRDMLARFNDLCKQSLRPNLTEFDFTHKNKYDTVYNILCAFANCFEDESKFVKKNSLMRKDSATKIDQQESTLSLQRANKSFQEAYKEKLIDQKQTLLQEEKEKDLNLQLYREIFFIRIYKALEETIERVCASIDSFNRLNKLKKQSKI